MPAQVQSGRGLKPGVFEVGVLDWNRRLFDQLIPLPQGTTYNAYVVQGSDKTVLIDTCDPPKIHLLFEHLERLGIEKLDYVISQHAEQDHSGSLPAVVQRFGCKVVTNEKCRPMLLDLLDLADDDIVTMGEQDQLDLGGKTLKFIMTPWVHWPETMSTWLAEDHILFTCDFFGSHLAASSLYADDQIAVYEPAKRYYAEIMMPFRAQIRKNIAKIENLPIEIIAPSHGPVYRDPKFIMDAYRDWAGENVKNEVVLPYVSMHGSTERMTERLTDALMQRGIAVHRFDLAVTDLGQLAVSLVDAATVLIGSPTVLTQPHPMAVYAAFLVAALRPKTKFAGVFGSYGWAGKMPERLAEILTPLRVELFEPVIAKGHPKSEDLDRLETLADQVLAKHRQLGIA